MPKKRPISGIHRHSIDTRTRDSADGAVPTSAPLSVRPPRSSVRARRTAAGSDDTSPSPSRHRFVSAGRSRARSSGSGPCPCVPSLGARAIDVPPVHCFQIPRRRQGLRREALSIVAPQRFRVGDDPRLHGLNHEVYRLRFHVQRVPPVTGTQILPRLRPHRSLRVDQQHHDAGVAGAQCIPKARNASSRAPQQTSLQRIAFSLAARLSGSSSPSMPRRRAALPALLVPPPSM